MRKRLFLFLVICFIVVFVGIGSYKSGYRKGYDEGSFDSYKQVTSEYAPISEDLSHIDEYSNEEEYTYILNKNTKKF
ncbi:MAG: hypothetical protein K5669_02330, partial [Lachnospiraceae bacterium]|nr:hypothetical protein [Lachnospiraceae bacterium]